MKPFALLLLAVSVILTQCSSGQKNKDIDNSVAIITNGAYYEESLPAIRNGSSVISVFFPSQQTAVVLNHVFFKGQKANFFSYGQGYRANASLGSRVVDTKKPLDRQETNTGKKPKDYPKYLEGNDCLIVFTFNGQRFEQIVKGLTKKKGLDRIPMTKQ